MMPSLNLLTIIMVYLLFYLAPEELLEMQMNKKSLKVSSGISQTFSIGIIVLELCTFVNADSFYDMIRYRLNEMNIDRALTKMEKNRYSKLLCNLVSIMLTSAGDRPLPSQIYAAFKPYERQIQTLQKFDFDPNMFYQSLYRSRASDYHDFNRTQI